MPTGEASERPTLLIYDRALPLPATLSQKTLRQSKANFGFEPHLRSLTLKTRRAGVAAPSFRHWKYSAGQPAELCLYIPARRNQRGAMYHQTSAMFQRPDSASK